MIKLRLSENIQRLDIYNNEVSDSGYADDVTIIISYHEQSLREVIRIINEFGEISGLRLQLEKTNNIRIRMAISRLKQPKSHTNE